VAPQPAHGDIVVSSDLTSHTVFIVPDRQQTRFANFDAAMDIAKRWATLRNVSVWLTTDGLTFTSSDDS
jgi:hypothetical protein